MDFTCRWDVERYHRVVNRCFGTLAVIIAYVVSLFFASGFEAPAACHVANVTAAWGVVVLATAFCFFVIAVVGACGKDLCRWFSGY